MKNFFSLFMLTASALIAVDAAQASENFRVAATEPVVAARRHVAPSPDAPHNDAGMQAICRDVVVETDEGYGVTSRESRRVCEEGR